MCVSDPQDHAESFDLEAIGSTRRLLSDEAEVDDPPERPRGVLFADSDESFAERDEQQQPDISEPSDKGVEGSTEDSRERDERA